MRTVKANTHSTRMRFVPMISIHLSFLFRHPRGYSILLFSPSLFFALQQTRAHYNSYIFPGITSRKFTTVLFIAAFIWSGVPGQPCVPQCIGTTVLAFVK